MKCKMKRQTLQEGDLAETSWLVTRDAYVGEFLRNDDVMRRAVTTTRSPTFQNTQKLATWSNNKVTSLPGRNVIPENLAHAQHDEPDHSITQGIGTLCSVLVCDRDLLGAHKIRIRHDHHEPSQRPKWKHEFSLIRLKYDKTRKIHPQ